MHSSPISKLIISSVNFDLILLHQTLEVDLHLERIAVTLRLNDLRLAYLSSYAFGRLVSSAMR